MKALKENSDLPVPKPFFMCHDTSIIGSAFYVSLTEFVEGKISYLVSDVSL